MCFSPITNSFKGFKDTDYQINMVSENAQNEIRKIEKATATNGMF